MHDFSNKKAVLFDLDGTLTDPSTGITNSVMYALRHYGISAEREALLRFIGPPLTDSFERFYGFSHEQAVEAVEVYREYFRGKGIFENTIYPGIRALLAALSGTGRTVIMATSKPEVFARRIADHFAMTPFFHTIAGSWTPMTASMKMKNLFPHHRGQLPERRPRPQRRRHCLRAPAGRGGSGRRRHGR